MTCAILWLVASAAFALGWALRPTARPTMRTDIKRIVLDWGAAHRLLDQLQIASKEIDLAPRVRVLVDHLVAATGWPAGRPDPDRFSPRTWPPDATEDDPPPPPFRVR